MVSEEQSMACSTRPGDQATACRAYTEPQLLTGVSEVCVEALVRALRRGCRREGIGQPPSGRRRRRRGRAASAVDFDGS